MKIAIALVLSLFVAFTTSDLVANAQSTNSQSVLGACEPGPGVRNGDVESSIIAGISEYLIAYNDYLLMPDDDEVLTATFDRLFARISSTSLDYHQTLGTSAEVIENNSRQARDEERARSIILVNCRVTAIEVLTPSAALVESEVIRTENGIFYTGNWRFTMHFEDDLWKVNASISLSNCNLLIDYVPLQELPPQTQNSVTVQPVGLTRCIDSQDQRWLIFIFGLDNQANRTVIWDWGTNVAATFVFSNQTLSVDNPATGLRFEVRAPYPLSGAILDGFHEYPVSIRLQNFNLCSTVSCRGPDPFSDPWQYEFVLMQPSVSPDVTGEVPDISNPYAVLTITASQEINVRSCPGTNCEPVGKLSPGDSVPLLRKTTNGGWYQVSLEDNELGWVRADLGTPSVDPVNVPIVSGEENVPTCHVTTRAPGVPFFVRPDPMSDRLGNIGLGLTFEAMRRINGVPSDYFEVTINGQVGYLPSFFLTVDSAACSALPG